MVFWLLNTREMCELSRTKVRSQKNKIPFGTDKGYYPDGHLAYVRSYDANGRLISEEKHAH